MTESKAVELLKNNEERKTAGRYINVKHLSIMALEDVQQYRVIGTPEEIKQKLAELERWHTTEVNPKIKNVFANTSTLICHNCDHKDEYIEELEAEIEEYRAIGTVEECRNAVERLTEKLQNGVYAAKSPLYDMVDKLAEYEDLEEQGLLLRLPCKEGDSIYSVIEDGLAIVKLKFSLAFYVRRKNDFGKTVFLTQEEAEQKLKEMESDRYDN